MNITDFKRRAGELGYGETNLKDFPPHYSGGDLHTHEFSAYALVAEGAFIVEYDDGPVTYHAGDSCELPAGTRHTEKAGAAGAKVWFAKK